MSLYGYLSGAWRLGHSFDAWDTSAGVWRDVKEIYAFRFGFWRQIYRRAYLNTASVEVVPGDPFNNYVITVPVSGIAAGTVTCVIRLNGSTVAGSGIVTPGSQIYSTLGSGGVDTLDVLIYNSRGRLLDSATFTL